MTELKRKLKEIPMTIQFNMKTVFSFGSSKMFVPPCNSTCLCDELVFDPVCGSDGLTYFSGDYCEDNVKISFINLNFLFSMSRRMQDTTWNHGEVKFQRVFLHCWWVQTHQTSVSELNQFLNFQRHQQSPSKECATTAAATTNFTSSSRSSLWQFSFTRHRKSAECWSSCDAQTQKTKPWRWGSFSSRSDCWVTSHVRTFTRESSTRLASCGRRFAARMDIVHFTIPTRSGDISLVSFSPKFQKLQTLHSNFLSRRFMHHHAACLCDGHRRVLQVAPNRHRSRIACRQWKRNKRLRRRESAEASQDVARRWRRSPFENSNRGRKLRWSWLWWLGRVFLYVSLWTAKSLSFIVFLLVF